MEYPFTHFAGHMLIDMHRLYCMPFVLGVFMNENQLIQIKNHPAFKEMEAKKSKLGIAFTILTLVIYFSYIIMIGTNPALFGSPVAAGKVTTIGIYWGIFVILFSIIITAIYVYKANGEFDDLTKKMMDELELTPEKPVVVNNTH